MNVSSFGLPALVAYLAATILLARSFRTEYDGDAVSISRVGTLTIAWLGAFLHGASLLDMCDRAGNVNFSFLSTSSLATLGIVAILLLSTLRRPVDKLGIIVFPLASILVSLRLLLPDPVHIVKPYSWSMDLHILLSMLAYSFLNIAAIQAILVALQDWHLRNRHTSHSLVRTLPPLQSMEKMLFQLIGTGFVLLTGSLITGFVYLDDLFGQHLAHKTVLSILAWVIFAALLTGRYWAGWRGQTAIRWTLGGFLSLMLAYFGSKMVLEWILGRT